jgi:hypothetical protein
MTTKTKRPTIEQAKREYVHRFTMEHVPAWAAKPMPNGTHYAPQYASDAEWYANTLFPGEEGNPHSPRLGACYSTNPTWPLGHFLTEPYRRK